MAGPHGIAPALLAALLAGCAAQPGLPACIAPTGDFAWVVQRDWHTEIGLPAALLTGALAPLRAAHPGAAAFLFGFGKRSWMQAQEGELLALLAGPWPGEGLMQVTALTVAPEAAFEGRAEILRAALPAGGRTALEAALAESFAPGAGTPHAGGSSFFPASRRYSLGYTCNTWTAEMLRRAGLPLRVEGVLGTAGVMRQVASHARCHES